MEGAAITINNVNINIGALLITPFVFAVAFYVFNRWIIKGLFSSSPQSPVHDASLEVDKNSHSRRDRIVEQIISGTISAILAGIPMIPKRHLLPSNGLNGVNGQPTKSPAHLSKRFKLGKKEF